MHRCASLSLLFLLAYPAPVVVAESPAMPQVHLYGSWVEWSVSRAGVVHAELRDGAAVVGIGEVEALASGDVSIPIYSTKGARLPVVIRPGYRLKLAGPDGEFEIAQIPLVAGDVDGTRRVAGVIAASSSRRSALGTRLTRIPARSTTRCSSR